MTNKGIYCRHFFRVMRATIQAQFHIGYIICRWYKDNKKTCSVSSENFILCNFYEQSDNVCNYTFNNTNATNVYFDNILQQNDSNNYMIMPSTHIYCDAMAKFKSIASMVSSSWSHIVQTLHTKLQELESFLTDAINNDPFPSRNESNEQHTLPATHESNSSFELLDPQNPVNTKGRPSHNRIKSLLEYTI